MSAIISSCGQYRYQLGRAALTPHPVKGPALFLMLNPSTADASIDDPTIRRCRGFAESWGCDGIVVANLYALRTTNPAALWEHADPIGIHNDNYLRLLAKDHEDVVCAWGANARPDRVVAATAVFTGAGRRMWCLGVTKAGAPRHPLYVRGDQPLLEWRMP